MDDKVIALAAAYLQGNTVAIEDIPKVLRTIETALDESRPEPAVKVEESIHDDYLVCLEDGARVTLLKRYLNKHFGLSPEEYREKWGLPDDYPMVPRKYSEKRSGIAKEQGLGKIDQ